MIKRSKSTDNYPVIDLTDSLEGERKTPSLEDEAIRRISSSAQDNERIKEATALGLKDDDFISRKKEECEEEINDFFSRQHYQNSKKREGAPPIDMDFEVYHLKKIDFKRSIILARMIEGNSAVWNIYRIISKVPKTHDHRNYGDRKLINNRLCFWLYGRFLRAGLDESERSMIVKKKRLE